jgi:transcriptional regulator of acetoin/glycerol metabolism
MVRNVRNDQRTLAGHTALGVVPVAAAHRHPDLIEKSHQRCSAFGLKRIEQPDYRPMMRSDLGVARARNQRLYAHAAPVMEMLFEQIAGTESMIVLTDAQGTILHSLGDDDFLGRAGKVALTPGVNWAEHSKGTNAIGTALFEAAPTLVHADEHYMHANHFLTCSAAPIFDPRGDMLGVLDVSGDKRSFHQHTMGLVRMSARMIENHWLCDDHRQRLRLHFHSRVEFIGTLLEGIVIVGEDGRFLGANRSALDQLNLSTVSLRAHTLGSLFGTSVGALVDHFRSPLQVPMQLHVPGGARFHAIARANWAAVSTRGSSVVPAEPAQPAGAAPSGLQFLRTGDPQVEALLQKLMRVLDRDIPVLLLGETGTGKELLARAMHQDSNRARQPFVAVDCAAIDASRIEAQLFGDADPGLAGERRKSTPGRIVQANGGTLFLHEIGALSLALQARLLHVLQHRSLTPTGSRSPVSVDIAVIGSTQRDMRGLIDQGRFREDLCQRLSGLAVRLPPLRERSDLGALVQRILQLECPGRKLEASAAVMGLFRACAWPGNVRQLASVLRTAAVLAEGDTQITEAHLSDNFAEAAQHAAPPRETTLEEAELDIVRQMIASTHGNISEAAKRLGVSRNTLYRKLRRPPNASA